MASSQDMVSPGASDTGMLSCHRAESACSEGRRVSAVRSSRWMAGPETPSGLSSWAEKLR